MASLLGWLGNGVKRLENTVHNDVVKPVQRNIVQPVQNVVQRDVVAPAQRTFAPTPAQQHVVGPPPKIQLGPSLNIRAINTPAPKPTFPTNNKPDLTSHLSDFLVNSAQQIPRGIVRIGESGQNLDRNRPQVQFTPTNRLTRDLVAPGQIQSYQAENKQHKGGIAGGLAVAGSLAGDLPIPGKKQAAEVAGKALEKTTAKDVTKEAKSLKGNLKSTTPPKIIQGSGTIQPPKVPLAKSSAQAAKPLDKPLAIPDMRGSKPEAPKLNRAKALPSTAENTLPNNTPLDVNSKQRGFTESVKHSANYSKDLKKAVNSTYDPLTDKTTIANTQKFMQQGVTKAHNDVLRRIQSNARPDKQLVNDAGTVMQHLDSQGDTAAAQHIHELLSEHLTNSGQVSQAASLLLRRSPDGIYHKAVSDLKKAGQEVTPSVDEQLKAHREAIRATAPDSEERNIAVQKMKQFVASNIPSSVKDKVFAVWRAGLLTGPRTVAKIITSHGVHLPLERIKDIPGSAIDKTISLARHDNRRSLVMTQKGTGAGLMQGSKAAFGKQGYFRSGIDAQPGNNAVEFHQNVNFGKGIPAKITQGYVDGIGRLHGSLYKPFYYAQHLNSLYSQAKAAAKTAGLKGVESSNFIHDFVANPSHEALDIAANDAAHATFQQETALGKTASTIQKIPGIGRYLAPFTRIPSAIATDLIDYSPVGAMNTIVKGIKAARSNEGWTIADQRAFSQGLGRSITGTAAVIPGVMLYQKGMLNLDYPSNDPKEQKLWALQGRTADSVLIGGKWRSLGSLGPVGSVLALGGHLAKSMGEGKSPVQSGIDALAGGAKSIESQSYVSGISGAVNALNDPGRYANSLEKQYAGSIIPTGIAQVASAGDKLARQANNAGDTIKSKIPGLRQSLAPKTDAFGQNIPNGESGPGALVDPFYSSNARPGNQLTNEIQRLQNTGQGILPSTQPSKNTFDGVKTNLTKPQAQQLGAKIGQTTQTLWTTTINSPAYKNLPDDQKHQMLSNIMSDITTATKEQYAANNNLGQYATGFSGKPNPLSAKQAAIIDGKFDPNAYTQKQSTTTKVSKTKVAKNGKGVYTSSKAPKVSKAKSSGKARTTSLASYMKTVKSTNPKPIKTAKAPRFTASKSGPHFKTVSLKHYNAKKYSISGAKVA